MKKSVGHSFIQYLNIGFFVSSRVIAAAAVVLNLLIFSGQLFLVKNQAAWGTVMKTVFAIALVNLFLSIPVFVGAVKMKCNIPKMKNIGQYLLAEYFAMIALFVLTTPFFYIHTGGDRYYLMGRRPMVGICLQNNWADNVVCGAGKPVSGFHVGARQQHRKEKKKETKGRFRANRRTGRLGMSRPVVSVSR